MRPGTVFSTVRLPHQPRGDRPIAATAIAPHLARQRTLPSDAFSGRHRGDGSANPVHPTQAPRDGDGIFWALILAVGAHPMRYISDVLRMLNKRESWALAYK